MENTLTITLGTGKKVPIEKGSYVVQAWYNGMWHNVAAFPHTAVGADLAASVVEHIHCDAQVQIFN